jgi:hypothetical protein
MSGSQACKMNMTGSAETELKMRNINRVRSVRIHPYEIFK